MLTGEVERIRAAYARRALSVPRSRYSYFNPAHVYWMQQRERDLLRALIHAGWSDLREKRILEVGCGDGDVLRRFIAYGAQPQHLAGVDLLADQIEAAARLSPSIEFRCANAEHLPFGDERFDLVCQFTVFTSILDGTMRREVAREMLRVLRPDGLLLWYDFHLNNPHNPDVRGVTRREIRTLFKGCTIELRRVTLAPPVARRLAPWSVGACYLLEKVPWLCSHYLGVIRKRV